MSMKVGGESGDTISEINITPLVDVCLVLVIIFMVTTPFMTQSKLTVTLPKAATDESKNEEHVTVTIDKDGKMSVNEKDVKDDRELLQYVKLKLVKTSDHVVIIKADENVEHGIVIDAMDVIKTAKPKRIYFATQTNKSGAYQK
ncbi:MAG: biopolymer transporter ExbD [Spirochaetia bacterium]|nr:biopolymer transporter ExbD [Spirochaetia bacterium]